MWIVAQDRVKDDTLWYGQGFKLRDGGCIYEKVAERAEQIGGTQFDRGDYALAVKWWIKTGDDPEERTYEEWQPSAEDREACGIAQGDDVFFVVNSTELREIALDVCAQTPAGPSWPAADRSLSIPCDHPQVVATPECKVLLYGGEVQSTTGARRLGGHAFRVEAAMWLTALGVAAVDLLGGGGGDAGEADAAAAACFGEASFNVRTQGTSPGGADNLRGTGSAHIPSSAQVAMRPTCSAR